MLEGIPSFSILMPLPRATTKKVENYLDARTGKSGVPLNCVICSANVDPVDAPTSIPVHHGRHSLKLSTSRRKQGSISHREGFDH